MTAEAPETRRFRLKLGAKSRPILLLWGVRERNAYVDVDSELNAHFGFFRFSTRMDNLARWQIEGPWLWIKALGVRRGLRDGDISFAGVHTAGIRIDFKQRVHWGPFSVPRLYLTPEDLDGFAAALTEHGVPGEDVRRGA